MPTGPIAMELLKNEFFQKERSLGAGAFGAVELVLHKTTNLRMARKQLMTGGSEEDMRLILRELSILQKATNPGMVKFYGAYEHDGTLNILMECMDKGSLDDALNIVGRIEEGVACFICSRVVNALYFLKVSHNVIHRDLKPSNILYNSSGEIKICDFGVSGNLVDSIANTFVGTMCYMSPERIVGGEYSTKADVWSLGIVMIELLCVFTFHPKTPSCTHTCVRFDPSCTHTCVRFTFDPSCTHTCVRFVHTCTQRCTQALFFWTR